MSAELDLALAREEVVALHRAAEGYKTELKHWIAVASYLADCHAATAETEGSLKRTSAYQRKRFVSICRTAARMLQQGYAGPERARSIGDVIARCLSTADNLEQTK